MELRPEYSDAEIKQFLDVDSQALLGEGKTIVYRRLDDQALLSEVAHLIKGNNVIGWFQGRMEYGPRSLGNRSIIADPRNKENWQKVNLLLLL
jgi:carbamoyltransferase